ncbi:MAG: SLC13 family permease, partial [Pseudomonadota bacterium]
AALALRLADPFGDPSVSAAAAAIAFANARWATAALPEPLTAAFFFLVCVVGAVAPPEVAFAGFSSNAFGLVFGGLAIGGAIQHSGLADRAARAIAPSLDRSFAAAVAGSATLGLGLAFVMPSTLGRMVVLIPIIQALADRLGYAEGRGRTGVLLAALFGTLSPAFAILPANLPPMVLAGAAEAVFGVTPTYGPYLLLHFPVLGALKLALVILLIVALYRAPAPRPAAATAPAGRLTIAERRLIPLLAVTVTLWATDALHGVSPAWVSLAAGALVLTPGLGLGPDDGWKRIDVGPLIFIAAAVSLGVVAAEMGVSAALSDAARALPLTPGDPAGNFFTLAGVTTAAAMALGAPGASGALAPLAQSFADQAGWSLNAALMIQVVGVSTLVLPYQSPPLVVGAQMAGVRPMDAARTCLALAGLTILTLWPLTYLWWRWMDVI